MTVSPTPVGQPVVQVRPGVHRAPFWRRLIGFVAWIATGFGLFARRKHKQDEIVVYAVHQSFFLWALLLAGFVGSACVKQWPGSNIVWGWIYLWVLLYTLASLLFDVNTGKFLLWFGILCFIWLAARYMEDLKHVPVVSQFLRYFRESKPGLDPGFARTLSWALLPPWIGSLFHTFSQGRKTFTPNSIEETHMGHGCEIIDRSGLKFRRRYRDIFETILGMGACDLEAIDGNGNTVKRWGNILFLAFTWNKLDAVLHQRSATMEPASSDSNDAAESKDAPAA
ncbi:hypothetical protein BH10PLA1_BH10PLA1_14800 [soil metagenome]